jgi:hypothetical protein
VQWKGKIPAGVTYDKPVISSTSCPTVHRGRGGTVEPDWKLEGVDLMPFPHRQERRAAARVAVLAVR